jgi:hypothetical protein
MIVMEQYILDFGAMWFGTWGTLVSYNRLPNPNPTPRVPLLVPPLELLLCPKCAQFMWLARIEPDKPDHDRRTFECRDCDYTKTVVVKQI